MREIIQDFRGKYGFLSNFEICIVEFEGIKFNSAEAAFQAAKILNENEVDTIRDRSIFINISASESKRLGRNVKLRDNWDMIRDRIMLDIIRDKFTRNEDLKNKLLETKDAILIEGTSWHDNYWGNCTCSKCILIVGENKLGNILMIVRRELGGI